MTMSGPRRPSLPRMRGCRPDRVPLASRRKGVRLGLAARRDDSAQPSDFAAEVKHSPKSCRDCEGDARRKQERDRIAAALDLDGFEACEDDEQKPDGRREREDEPAAL